jgi:hypothetical protein
MIAQVKVQKIVHETPDMYKQTIALLSNPKGGLLFIVVAF